MLQNDYRFGSPNKANSHDCHGSALGADEVALGA
ncbi:MAG: hypothetical protein ACLR31_02650 [Escherichia coli]